MGISESGVQRCRVWDFGVLQSEVSECGALEKGVSLYKFENLTAWISHKNILFSPKMWPLSRIDRKSLNLFCSISFGSVTTIDSKSKPDKDVPDQQPGHGLSMLLHLFWVLILSLLLWQIQKILNKKDLNSFCQNLSGHKSLTKSSSTFWNLKTE